MMNIILGITIMKMNYDNGSGVSAGMIVRKKRKKNKCIIINGLHICIFFSGNT